MKGNWEEAEEKWATKEEGRGKLRIVWMGGMAAGRRKVVLLLLLLGLSKKNKRN
jgi:hypothetical protein